MSIGRAQAQAIADGYLNSRGESKDIAAGEMEIVKAVLAAAGAQFELNARANLERSKSVSTGELADSMQFDVTVLGDTYTLTVGYDKSSPAAKHFDFVNKGVKGVGGVGAPNSPYQFRTKFASRKMVQAIMKWQKLNGRQSFNIKKPISGLERKRKSIGDLVRKANPKEQLAWATATAIKRDGTEPTHFFDHAITQTFNPELRAALAVALAGEVRLDIRRINNQ